MAEPIILAFVVDPDTIDHGGEATLAWQCAFTDYVTITHVDGTFPAVGSVKVSPGSTTQYQLSAWGDGVEIQQIVLTVNQPPSDEYWTVTFWTDPPESEVCIDFSWCKTTGTDGRCTFWNVGSGYYHLSVSKKGYVTWERAGRAIFSDIHFNVELEPGEPPPPEQPPEPIEPPTFETDPIGFILYMLIVAVENTVGIFIPGIVDVLTEMRENISVFTAQIGEFFNDPVTKIKAWLGDALITIQSVLNQISSSISDWWSGVSLTVKTWIDNKATEIKDWANGVYVELSEVSNTILSGINAWWVTGKILVQSLIDSSTSALSSWIDDQYTDISEWWATNITLKHEYDTETIGDLEVVMQDYTWNSRDWLMDRFSWLKEWVIDWVAEQVVKRLINALNTFNDEMDKIDEEEGLIEDESGIPLWKR